MKTAILAATLLVGACGSTADRVTTPTATAPDLAPPSPPVSATCEASQARFAIGERASDQLLGRARIAAGASVARFIRPNEPITTEFLPWRLNLQLNDQDVVRAVSCG